MKKTLSIVMPVRIDTDERFENLRTVLAWIDQLGCPIIVLEADVEARLADLYAQYQHVEWAFAKDVEPVFHRTKYINHLLHRVKTPLAAVWDADIILPLEQVIAAVRMTCEKQLTIAYPYFGTFSMMTEEESAVFRLKRDPSMLRSDQFKPLMGRRSCGGVYIVDCNSYFSIGGENEKYHGWGPEDAERLRRAQIMGKRVEWLPQGTAFHLYHRYNISEKMDNNLNLHAMRKEFVRECCMNAEEMHDYIHHELLSYK